MFILGIVEQLITFIYINVGLLFIKYKNLGGLVKRMLYQDLVQEQILHS